MSEAKIRELKDGKIPEKHRAKFDK